jgi:hypothetical protein
MKQIFTLATILLATIAFSFDSQAADGDTTTIVAHQDVHWNWNGNFYDTVSFPTTGTYQKVIMHYVLGCPSIGCSEWDYTTLIQIWDENNSNDRFELAKVITPYAGDKNSSWHHEYKFDVTHMLPILNGEKVINARYDGWQDGFTISVYFEFIEGTPPRTPLQVNQVYYGGYPYGNNNNPINTQLQTDTINSNSATEEVEFIMSATGHGFGNNNGNGVNPENCAEFCDKWYKLKVNGATKYQQTVWRNDCGSEPLYAQTGTWIYNRAGWCPGSESQVFKHDITTSVTAGNPFQIKVDWQDYSATNVSMSYNISGQVVQYGPANHSLDAEVMDVLNPSSYDRYSRYNPTAQKPRIIVRNTGSGLINTIKIKYGVAGGTFYTTTLVTSLAFMESQEVTLPIPEHNFYKGNGSNVFIAEILEVNGSADQVPSNNIYRSEFESIPQYNGQFTLKVKTNNLGADNWYILTNAMGDTILYRNGLANNTTYEDTLDLPNQAYTFYIEDAGGDGLSWWANTAQGTGSIQLKNIGIPNNQPPMFYETLESDFGNLLIYDFSVGYNITTGDPSYDETVWTPPTTVGIKKITKQNTEGSFLVYPNPTTDIINIESVQFDGRTMIRVFNQTGILVYQNHLGLQNGSIESVSTKDWSNGVYYISLNDDIKKETIMFIKQ